MSFDAANVGLGTALSWGLEVGLYANKCIRDEGAIDVVTDWKSDIDPSPAIIGQYRTQVGDYLRASGASFGLIVFMTSGRIKRVLNSNLDYR